MPAALAFGLLMPPVTSAQPSLSGQSGLIHMPDARLAPEGMLRLGVSDTDPYFALWSSISFFPRLELSARYTAIERVPGFADPALGDYRDKAFDAKLLLVKESTRLPAVALGAQDYIGTRLFDANYVALGKSMGPFDLTLGYGEDRIDGLFGGLRLRPEGLPRWSFVVEYDAYDYARDFGAQLSGAAEREGGLAYGIEYRSGMWGWQLAWQDGEPTGNLYVAVPLMEREFVPKIHEPAPYSAVTERAPIAQWRADRRFALALAAALRRQGFSDLHVRVQGEHLELVLTHGRISLIGRAVGRAARTALRLGPVDMSGLRIVYTRNDQPLLTYAFRDPALLARYFAGRARRAELDASVEIAFASSELARQLRDASLAVAYDEAPPDALLEQDAFLAPRLAREPWADVTFLPFNVRLFFNDPGEPVRYDTFAAVGLSRRLARGLFLNAAARLTLVENVSDIESASTSLLPHVRSDVGEYRREGGSLRLTRLLLNRYLLPRERWYARVSAGYYEEMFAGAGGQLLYLPRRGDWSADIAVDALRQREPGEALGLRDYSVITAIASLHYRWPSSGVTATARAGRFLAGDEGVRFELKRRFRSGVEIGGWYTWTNEDDITGPGSPGDPYRDKGLFVSIPLNSMLTRDTQERASMAIADFTRDVGQMVASPGDLYRAVERSLVLDSAAHDPLTDFAR